MTVIENGRNAEAREIVLKLHGDEDPTDSSDAHRRRFAELEYEEMVAQITADSRLPSSWLSIMQVPSYRKRAIIGFFTMFAAQCTGTQVINSMLDSVSLRSQDTRAELHLADYGPALYQSMGFDTKKQLLISAGWITLGIPANFLNALLLDRVGRKWLMSRDLSKCTPTTPWY